MKIQTKEIALAFILLLVSFQFVFGQEEKKISGCWGTIGAGIANHYKMGSSVSGNLVWKKQLIGLRAVGAQNLSSGPYGYGFQSERRGYEIGLFWGKYFLSPKKKLYAALAVGPAYEIYYTAIGRDGSHPYYGSNGTVINDPVKKFSTFSLAIDVQSGVNLGKHFGIGTHIFASVNTQATIVGILLSIRAGNLFSE